MNYHAMRIKHFNQCQLMGIGDIHWGEKNCDINLVRRTIDYCLKNRVYVLGMGDLLNVGTKQSIGKGPYDQYCDTTEQFKQIRRLLLPLAKENLLIGLLEGNHESRSSNEGMDIMSLLSESLEVPYFGYSVVLKIIVGKNAYIGYATHGKGGSTALSSVINQVKKLSNIVDADFYMRGHSHKLFAFSTPIRRVDVRNNKLIETERYFIDTGSFLKYDNAYPDQANLEPVMTGTALITLSGVRRAKGMTVQTGKFI